MKKTVFAVSAALLLGLFVPVRARAAEDISAKAAIVYEPVTGTVLYEKCADEPMLIASTTKIMTAMVVLENCGLDEQVDITSAHAAVEGSSMYLRPGGDYTVRDLLYGLMLASGNDAAAALADHTAGSMEAFAELMNRRCGELGLENTHFANAHGLDAEGHYGSARDLAVITAAAMENDLFREIFATECYSLNGVDYYNHNKLLGLCPGCIGGKTGYTERAGRILVSCVEREGMELICVTISDPRDWEDHMALYEQCFGEYEFLPVPEEGRSISLVSGMDGEVELKPDEEGLVARKSDGLSMRVCLPRFVFAPVYAGETAGWVEIFSGDEERGRIEICFARNAALDESQRLGLLESMIVGP